MSVYDSGIALLGKLYSFQEAFSLKKKKSIAKKGNNSKMFVEIMTDMRQLDKKITFSRKGYKTNGFVHKFPIGKTSLPD